MADPTTAVPNVGDLAWDGAKWQRWNGSAWQDITLTDTRFDQYSYVSMNPDGSIDAVLRDGGPDEHIVGGTSVDKKPSTAVAANAYTLPALSDDAIWKAAGYTKPDWWPAGEQAPFTKEVDDKGKPTGTFLLDKDHVKFVQDEVNRKTAEAKAAAAAAKTTAYPATNLAKTAAEVEAAIAKGKADGSLKGNYVVEYDAGSNGYYMKAYPATNLAKTAAEVEAAIAKGKADGSLKGNYVVGYDAGSNGYYMKEVPPTVVDSLNTMIDKALIAKDWDQARRLDDFRQRPSPAQVMDLAIKYASSPADYFSLLGMARGEIAIDPAKAGQALREVGRVAPNAPFLDAAWKQVFGAAYPNQAGTGGAVTDPSIPPGMVKDAAGNLIPAPGLEFGPNGVLQQKAPSVAANQGAPQAPFTVPGAQTAFDRGGGTRGALTTVDQGAAQAGAGMTFAQPGAQLNNIAAGQGNPPESQGGPPLMTFGAPANVQLGPQNQTPEQAALQGAGISPEATGLRPYYANTPAGQQPGVNAPHNFLSPPQLAQANYGMITEADCANAGHRGERR